MVELYSLDGAAANNNAAPPHGYPEFMEYDEVNDAGRELMAKIKRWLVSATGGTIATTGTATAYELESGLTYTTLAAGMVFAFTAHLTSTGAVTLNVDFKGAVPVVDGRGLQLGEGDLVQGGVYVVARTATNFRLMGQLSLTSLRSLNTIRQAFTSTGAANVYTIAPGLAPAYANGQLYAFLAHQTNTGATQFSVDAQALEALVDMSDQALAAGDIVAGRLYVVGRSGGKWRALTSVPIDLAAAAGQVSGVLPIANGGTSANTAATARTALGIGTGDTPTFRSALFSGPVGSGESEGGEINLGVGASGHTLSGTSVALDIFGNFLRIFETGGNTRGARLDFTKCANGIASDLLHSSNIKTQPGYANAWAIATYTSGVPAINASHNVSSVTDTGTGILTFNFAAAFANAVYVHTSGVSLTTTPVVANASTKTTTQLGFTTHRSDTGTAVDTGAVCFAAHGPTT